MSYTTCHKSPRNTVRLRDSVNEPSSRVLFVGSNPSRSSPSRLVPFVGTKSHTVLSRWLDECCGGMEVWAVNVHEEPGAVRARHIHQGAGKLASLVQMLWIDKVVALGRIAQEACWEAGIEFYPMPHPSGLNRVLNNKQGTVVTVRRMREYLER